MPRIDIAWNTNLAYLQADEWSCHACRAVAMRDSDLGWMTKIVAATGGPISSLVREGRDYGTLRFDSDLGKHGDTGTSEVEVVRAVLDGRAHAGAIGSPFWNTVRNERLVPEGGLREIWSSPTYNHCMFTARPDLDLDLDLERERRFAEALSAMSYDNPVHRSILEAEGLQRWLQPHVDGYSALRQAAAQQGFFNRAFAKSA